MERQVVIIGVPDVEQSPWALALPRGVVVEVCHWTRLSLKIRARPAAVILAPMERDMLLPLLQQLRALPGNVPIAVSLTVHQESLRAELAGASEILMEPSPEDVVGALQRMVLAKAPPPPSAPAAGQRAWPPTTFDPGACEQALRQYMATSAVPDLPGAVPFVDLLPFCRSLTESDKAVLTAPADTDPVQSVLRQAVVLTARLHGVARSVPKAGEPVGPIDTAALGELRKAVEALKAELERLRPGVPPAAARELERCVPRLEGTWREVEQAQRAVESRPAVPQVVAAPVPAPAEKREATRPAAEPARTPREPTRAPTALPPGAGKGMSGRKRAVFGGAFFGIVVLVLGWELVTYFVPSTDHQFSGIAGISQVAAQGGAAVAYVDDTWVPDPAHVEALKEEFAQRGIVDLQVLNKNSGRIVLRINPQAPADKKL